MTPTTDELIKRKTVIREFQKGKIYHIDETDYGIIPTEYSSSFEGIGNEHGLGDKVTCLRDIRIEVKIIYSEISKIKQALSSACENENSMQKQALGEK